MAPGSSPPITRSLPPTTYDPDADIIPVDQNDIVRLKIFIPLATLTAMFSNLVCALLIKPSMADINERYYTLLTPGKFMLGVYWLAIFACQIGMAFMVVCTSNVRYRTEETKQMFVHGLGMGYVLALFAFALWPIFWAAELFVASTVILGLVFLLMTYILHSIWRHSIPSITEKPFSYIFIYIPVHLFQVILFTVDLPQSLLLSLKWYQSPVNHTWERNHTTHAWIVFGMVLLIGLVNALVIYRAKDLIRTLATVYLSIAVIINGKGNFGKVAEAPQVTSALAAAIAAAIISFVASFIELGPGRSRIMLIDEEERRARAARES